jgi:hypothetical protein
VAGQMQAEEEKDDVRVLRDSYGGATDLRHA